MHCLVIVLVVEAYHETLHSSSPIRTIDLETWNELLDPWSTFNDDLLVDMETNSSLSPACISGTKFLLSNLNATWVTKRE